MQLKWRATLSCIPLKLHVEFTSKVEKLSDRSAETFNYNLRSCFCFLLDRKSNNIFSYNSCICIGKSFALNHFHILYIYTWIPTHFSRKLCTIFTRDTQHSIRNRHFQKKTKLRIKWFNNQPDGKWSDNIVAKNYKYLVALENSACLSCFHKQNFCIFTTLARIWSGKLMNLF